MIALKAMLWWALIWCAFLLALQGCAPCDYVERGGCFIVEEGAIPLPQYRAKAVLLQADIAWGKTIDLEHYEITFRNEPRVCGDAVGCAASKWPASHIDLARMEDPCQLSFVFWHELGHVAEPYAPHDDPRFTPTKDMASAFCPHDPPVAQAP